MFKIIKCRPVVIIFIILAVFCHSNFSFADSFDDWLHGENFTIERREYREDRVDMYGYAIVLPKLSKDFSYIPNVGLVQKQYDENGSYIGNKTVSKFTINIKIGGTEIPLEVNTATDIVRAGDGLKIILATDKTKDDKDATYKDSNNNEVTLKGNSIKLANGEIIEGSDITVRNLADARINNVSFSGESDDVHNVTPRGTSRKEDGISIWSRIGSWFAERFEDLKEWAIDKVSGIFNALLLPFGDGIHSLIEEVYGGEVSIEKIVYNQEEKLGINFWKDSTNTESTGVIGKIGNSLKVVVRVWYDFFSGIAIAFMIGLFLYTTIRIILSSTGKGLQDAKERLVGWIMGIVILFTFPYVMKYIVVLNDSLVELVASEGSELKDTSADTMQIIRALAGEDGLLPNKEHVKGPDGKDLEIEGLNSLPLTIAYIILNGQLVMLLITYYRRAFIVAFLITMFPIIAAYSLWEKVHNGKRTVASKMGKIVC